MAGTFLLLPLDETHAWAAVRYVERNPVRTGMARRAEDYRWSSAAAHAGLRRDALLSPDFPPAGVVKDWRAWLKSEDDFQSEDIRRKTHTGRPCGAESFVDQLEAVLDRSLHPGKRGRKKKAQGPPEPGLFNESSVPFFPLAAIVLARDQIAVPAHEGVECDDTVQFG